MSQARFTIVDLASAGADVHKEAALLLHTVFRADWPEAWPDMDAARQEVREMVAEDRIARAALDENGRVLGWIGGICSYDGYVWELHPLVVRPDVQRQGIGRALVGDLEARVAARGALTLMVGSDDVSNLTTVGGVDLYPHPLDHLQRIQNLRNHPYTFYQRCGFTIVGIIPDANGFGKPDIFMAKRVQSPPGAG